LSNITISHKNYEVIIEEPTIYVDNEARNRSGHMTHALAPVGENGFIDFNSNCAKMRYEGHSAFGWIEYRISKDAGKTYSEIYDLPYAKEAFLEGVNTISVEKAVTCDDGTIVAFCLRNCQTDPVCCEPWDTPYVVTSCDEGKTWSEPTEMTTYKGRIYDAVYVNGKIYVLLFCNDHFVGETDEHQYRIFVSEDSGKTFSKHCVVPFDTKGRCYGSLLFDGKLLHAFAYNINAEDKLDHAVSEDLGKSWKVLPPCFLKEGIRNPQTAFIDGVYIIHGRDASRGGFVLYTSEDCENFDEGTFICKYPYVCGAFYSNNINLKDEKGNFLLIQYSDIYLNDCFNLDHWVATVNVKHTNLRVKRK